MTKRFAWRAVAGLLINKALPVLLGLSFLILSFALLLSFIALAWYVAWRLVFSQLPVVKDALLQHHIHQQKKQQQQQQPPFRPSSDASTCSSEWSPSTTPVCISRASSRTLSRGGSGDRI
ncbi:unnamed protein product [Vitrella brassicaformis CCMP3155]|uniref:Uncharacterized protein n=1 Tax=Vitrella brassicaformis (strain CCMP3155) TaxID=1169540 RepID=A0A0G4GGW3_VITBC|nr:unnamed protein product [Vitrella brassicaformis CCMP3155]|eukprot:CEM28896.1 unnamed protein product [Vitrella brassicaformis CCMP3155]